MMRMLAWTVWASAALVMTEPVHLSLYQTSMTWNEANRMCQGNGQQLFNLDSLSKASMFRDIVARWRARGKLGYNEDLWSGLHDGNEPNRDYRWSDCTPLTWSIWYSGEPNYWNTDHCIRLDNDGLQFRTDRCNKNYKFVCEHKLDGCWFETFGGSKLSGSLYNAGVLGHTQCRKKCQTYTMDEKACVAISVDNDGTCWLSMAFDLFSADPPAMTCSSTMMTDVKRCYSYSSRIQSSSYNNNNGVPKHTCTPLPPPSPATQSVTTTTMPGCIYVPTTTTTTTTTSTTTTMTSAPLTTTTSANPSTTTTTTTTTSPTTITLTSVPVTTTTSVNPSATTTTTTTTTASTAMTSSTTSSTVITSLTTISSTTAIGPTSSSTTVYAPPTAASNISAPAISSTSNTSTGTDTFLNKKGYKLCPCRGFGQPSKNQFLPAVEVLLVDKPTLSKTKRKLTSAHDNRESAMVIGVSGVTIVSCFMLIIFLLDCNRIIQR